MNPTKEVGGGAGSGWLELGKSTGEGVVYWLRDRQGSLRSDFRAGTVQDVVNTPQKEASGHACPPHTHLHADVTRWPAPAGKPRAKGLVRPSASLSQSRGPCGSGWGVPDHAQWPLNSARVQVRAVSSVRSLPAPGPRRSCHSQPARAPGRTGLPSWVLRGEPARPAPSRGDEHSVFGEPLAVQRCQIEKFPGRRAAGAC